jgi:hypothetical protein
LTISRDFVSPLNDRSALKRLSPLRRRETNQCKESFREINTHRN